MIEEYDKSLVIYSGGLDSTTCLLWALKNYTSVLTITFNYRQRHQIEIESAQKIVKILNSIYRKKFSWLQKKSVIEHSVIDLSFLSTILRTSLIHDIELMNDNKTNPPSTFVPGRNILFLTIAAAIAYQKNIKNLVIGVSQTDFSGYPDCRDSTIKATQVTLKLGLDYDIIIHTPLMWKTKSETIKLMQEFADIDLLKYTHTCYTGERPACGVCDACKLRIEGFKELKIEDPLEYRKISR